MALDDSTKGTLYRLGQLALSICFLLYSTLFKAGLCDVLAEQHADALYTWFLPRLGIKCKGVSVCFSNFQESQLKQYTVYKMRHL